MESRHFVIVFIFVVCSGLVYVENSLYCRLSIEQSPSRYCGLSVDDVQQCDCWHHHFSLLVCVPSQSRFNVSTRLTNIGSLEVEA